MYTVVLHEISQLYWSVWLAAWQMPEQIMSSVVDMFMEPGLRFPRLSGVSEFRFPSVHVQLIKFTGWAVMLQLT